MTRTGQQQTHKLRGTAKKTRSPDSSASGTQPEPSARRRNSSVAVAKTPDASAPHVCRRRREEAPLDHVDGVLRGDAGPEAPRCPEEVRGIAEDRRPRLD